MTTVADDNDMQDWVADCNRKGRERTVRDGGDTSGVVMLAVMVEDGGGGQQRQRRTR